MASIQTLREGWTLTDGVFPPFPVEAPLALKKLLARRGLTQEEPRGLNALKDEWALRRSWLFEVSLPARGDWERCRVEISDAGGPGEILVNGRFVADFSEGPVSAELSYFLRGEGDRLAIRMRPGAPGILSPVRLRLSGGVMIEKFSCEAVSLNGKACLRAKVSLRAEISGKLNFRYGAALGDEALGGFAFTEYAAIGEAEFTHTLPLRAGAPYDPARAEDTLYTLRLSLERAGMQTDIARADAAFLPEGARARRALRMPRSFAADPDRLRAALDWARELGADSLAGEGRLSEGFLPWDGAGARSLDRSAMPRGRTADALSDGEKNWPQGTPVWKLTASDAIDTEEIERLFGENAAGDAARCADLTRYLQAAGVRRAALGARLEGAVAAYDAPFEEEASYASRALVERSGEKRPAFYALQEAWAETALSFEAPDSCRPGAELLCPLRVYSRRESAAPLSVSAWARDCADGNLLCSASFVAGAGDQMIGALKLRAPGAESLILLCAEARDAQGNEVARTESLLCAASGAPLAPLLRCPSARLLRGEEKWKNAERSVAVAFPGGRSLLPGEEIGGARALETQYLSDESK